MRTPATLALERAQVAFEVARYEAPDDGDFGAAVVEALGLVAEQVGKTLVAMLDDGRPVVAVVPVSTTLDLKALARACGAKRAAMAPVADAERLTGMVVGGIAPLGYRRPLDVVVDEALAAHPTVHVSGGRRGVELSVAAADLVRACGATVAPIGATMG